ncbi:MAG: hypothetical protein FVQ77_16940 [Cytophagales bacterium]|nr:hypothetical protein [Cytophagales bacterium]
MKKLYYSLAAMLLCTAASAQNYQWAKNIGSIGNDIGNSIAVDASPSKNPRLLQSEQNQQNANCLFSNGYELLKIQNWSFAMVVRQSDVLRV